MVRSVTVKSLGISNRIGSRRAPATRFLYCMVMCPWSGSWISTRRGTCNAVDCQTRVVLWIGSLFPRLELAGMVEVTSLPSVSNPLMLRVPKGTPGCLWTPSGFIVGLGLWRRATAPRPAGVCGVGTRNLCAVWFDEIQLYDLMCYNVVDGDRFAIFETCATEGVAIETLRLGLLQLIAIAQRGLVDYLDVSADRWNCLRGLGHDCGGRDQHREKDSMHFHHPSPFSVEDFSLYNE